MHPAFLCRSLLLAALLAFPAAATRLTAMSLEGRQDRRQFAAAVKEAFLREDYATLEATAGNVRAKRDRFPEGVWTLTVFYDALALKHMPLAVIHEFPARLERWQAAQPGSATVRIVRSQALRDSGWERVEGGKTRSEPDRLRSAQAELDAAAGATPGPDWFAESLWVAWRSGVLRSDFEALFARAVAAEPGYHPFYFIKALALRRSAGAGAWETFARESGEKNLSNEGMGLYSRIAWSLGDGYADDYLFHRTAIEWPRMRDGFRDLERAWPDSEWNLNNFCRFACLAGDRGTARELFARIGDRWTTNWLSHAAFEGWRTWATADVDPLASPAVPLAVPGEERRRAGSYAVAFAPDGQSVFGGLADGHIVRWDAATGAVRWRGELGAGHVRGLAVSPDGRTLAAAAARTPAPEGTGGNVGVWDLAPGGEPAPLPARWLGAGSRRGVLSLRWAADGRTLAAAGGSFEDGFGELWAWAMPEGRPVRHLDNWPLPVGDVAFLAADGRQLVHGSAQSFFAIETATGEKVFTPATRLHENFVRALAVAPDGKTLACATAAPYRERDRPSEVAFWDTTTWTRRTTPGITHAGGVLALVWSPDGRWLAGGGYDGFLRVWDAATGRTVQSWPPEPGGGPITAVAWAPEGRRVAVTRSVGAGSVHVFDPPPAAR